MRKREKSNRRMIKRKEKINKMKKPMREARLIKTMSSGRRRCRISPVSLGRLARRLKRMKV
jgi:hypothetical protein